MSDAPVTTTGIALLDKIDLGDLHIPEGLILTLRACRADLRSRANEWTRLPSGVAVPK